MSLWDVLCFFQFHKTVKSGMKRQLSEDYQFENTIGKAWNFVQVRVSEQNILNSLRPSDTYMRQ